MAAILSSTRERLEAQGLDVKGGAVEDIATGTVLMELGGAKSGRLAALHAGCANLGALILGQSCSKSCVLLDFQLTPPFGLSTDNARRRYKPFPTLPWALPLILLTLALPLVWKA